MNNAGEVELWIMLWFGPRGSLPLPTSPDASPEVNNEWRTHQWPAVLFRMKLCGYRMSFAMNACDVYASLEQPCYHPRLPADEDLKYQREDPTVFKLCIWICVREENSGTIQWTQQNLNRNIPVVPFCIYFTASGTHEQRRISNKKSNSYCKRSSYTDDMWPRGHPPLDVGGHTSELLLVLWQWSKAKKIPWNIL